MKTEMFAQQLSSPRALKRGIMGIMDNLSSKGGRGDAGSIHLAAMMNRSASDTLLLADQFHYLGGR